MTENTLINKLEQLKDIKPRQEWAVLLKAQILNTSPDEIAKKVDAKVAKPIKAIPATYFFLAPRYRMAFATFIFLALMSSTVVAAQKVGPTSFLYPIKTLTQKVVIAFAPDEQKPKLQLSYVQEKIDALNNIGPLTQRAKLSHEIKSDLSKATEQVKNIDKPSKVLAISKDLEEQTKILKNTVVIDDPEVSQSIEAANHDILTIIDSAKELADKCPIEVSAQLETLKNSVMSANLYPDQLTQANKLLIEAQKDLNNKVCLEALDKIKEIKDLLDANNTQSN